MSLRDTKLALLISLLAFAVAGNLDSKARAQQGNRPDIADPVAPPPPGQVTPTPNRDPQTSPGGRAQIAPSGQPGSSRSFEATDRNPPTPPVTNNRNQARTSQVSSRNASRRSNAFSPRLARAAPIMGDSLAPSLFFQDELGSTTRELPQGGGATRSKIAENSSSLPMDRFIFNYNHFHNAIDENLSDASNIDRFTVGLEKTFLDQMASIEVRFPFVVDNDFSIPGAFTRNGSDAGNLAVTLKGVLTSDSSSLFAAGLTIDTPTGDGTVLTIENIADPLTVDISNDAVHLSPFLGFLCAPSGGNIHQGFIQVDVPTNPNSLEFSDVGGVSQTELLEQTLLYIDYQFAKELYRAGRSARGSYVRRVLGLAEVHYTTTLEDSDIVLSNTTNNPLFEVTSAGNRLDVVNLTFGLHTELSGGSQLRLGTVAPITDDDDRFFDFEFQAQLNVPLY